MPIPLRVLILEDRPADAELMIHEIKKSGFEPTWVRVQTEADYLAQLATAPELILADHPLPQFNAAHALEHLRKQGLDIPFIVVTGSVSEETAAERIKQGAADYILKDRMTRLGPAVEHALREKRLREEKRRADEALKARYQLEALHDIAETILRSPDLKTISNAILDKALSVGHFDLGLIQLLDPGGTVLEPVAYRGYLDPSNIQQHRKLARDKATSEFLFREMRYKKPRALEDVPGNRGFPTFKREGIQSAVIVPIRAEEEVFGILQLGSRTRRKFLPEEIRLLETIGNDMGIAVQKARLHEQSERQLAELKRLNRVKDEFLSLMSHELRTPLTVVMGYTDLIKDRFLGDITPEQEKALGEIQNTSREQLAMINSILSATALEADAVRAEMQEVHLETFLDELRKASEVYANKELRLIWNYSSDLPMIRTDGDRLKQILQNLINNAIKFTTEGKVTISARDIPERKAAEFEVADTGIGIAKEMLPSIFERFRQVDSSQTRPYGGLGLGLYIVKRFTDLLGGTISVESKVGKGSTFRVSLPYSKDLNEYWPPFYVNAESTVLSKIKSQPIEELL